ncbi:MAG TPA: ABC transporter permease [Candidatus Angelobacter sp.]|nr:ABC transporter permease [Candidatus Angelobacter sp.]
MTLWHDVRFALRALFKARGLSIAAILTLALGIGANTAIFSVVDAVLLRSLPFRRPAELVRVKAELRGLGSQNVGFSVPELEDLRDRAGIFESVAAVWPAPANLTGGERPERVDILGVSPNYFEILGAVPQIGRLFDSRDRAPGFAEAAVISDALWHRDFGGDPHVLGKQVRVDNDLYTIVGVLPPRFVDPGPGSDSRVDFWGTAGFRADPFPPPARKIRLLPEIIGRLKPGLSLSQANGQLQRLADALRRENEGGAYSAAAGWSISLVPIKQVVVGSSHTLLSSLLIAVGLILLIACVNVASLLLARASAREKEMAVRLALGASRARIVRQLLTESVVISLVAGALGLFTAMVAERTLVSWLPAQLPRVNQININSTVLLFSLGLAVATAMIFGVVPALQASRTKMEGLKQDGRSGENTLTTAKSRKLLVAVEVALSLTLVVAAGLLLRTFVDLMRVNPGFTAEKVMAANVWLPVPNDPKTDIYATPQQRGAFVREVLRKVQEIPGVHRAALSSALPLRTTQGAIGFRVEGQPEQGDAPTAVTVVVSPEFFDTMGATFVRGRMVQEQDNDKAPRVVLVDEAAARAFWRGADPVGRRIKLAQDIVVNGKLQSPPWMTVIGVVSNIKFNKLDEANVPHVYGNMYQVSGKLFNVIVKATGDPAALGHSIQAAVQSIDANLPVSELTPMSEVISDSLADRRFAVRLVGGFALLALMLAAIGVYGVSSYIVAQRTRELGIRAALGASSSDLLRLTLRDGMHPVLYGVVGGAIGALLVGRLISSLLFGSQLGDVPVFVLSAATLLLIGLAANYIPARRAAKVDPNLVLRCE